MEEKDPRQLGVLEELHGGVLGLSFEDRYVSRTGKQSDWEGERHKTHTETE